MADILVRGLSAEQVGQMNTHAQVAGMSREAWARSVLMRACNGPLIRATYGIRGLGPDRVGQDCSSIVIRRGLEGLTTGHARDCSDDQMTAYHDAKRLIEANQAGYRERAIALLQAVDFEVYEFP